MRISDWSSDVCSSDLARASLERYFKRVHSKAGPRAFDQYTTRTYNNFSTLYGQLGFCQTAAQIGRAALATPKGSFHELAVARLREFKIGRASCRASRWQYG